jgi:hypothetical protein
MTLQDTGRNLREDPRRKQSAGAESRVGSRRLPWDAPGHRARPLAKQGAHPRLATIQRPMLEASAAARCMFADISLVTVLCSSTAAAVEVTYSLTS